MNQKMCRKILKIATNEKKKGSKKNQAKYKQRKSAKAESLLDLQVSAHGHGRSCSARDLSGTT